MYRYSIHPERDRGRSGMLGHVRPPRRVDRGARGIRLYVVVSRQSVVTVQSSLAVCAPHDIYTHIYTFVYLAVSLPVRARVSLSHFWIALQVVCAARRACRGRASGGPERVLLAATAAAPALVYNSGGYGVRERGSASAKELPRRQSARSARRESTYIGAPREHYIQ